MTRTIKEIIYKCFTCNELSEGEQLDCCEAVMKEIGWFEYPREGAVERYAY